MASKSVVSMFLRIAGTMIPFRTFTSKSGNLCYGVLAVRNDGSRYLSPYGVGIPAISAKLPTMVTLVEVTQTGTKSTEREIDTYGLNSDKTTKGRPRVSVRDIGVDLPGTDKTLNLAVSISDQADGTWNLSAKAIPGGGGGRRVVELGDL